MALISEQTKTKKRQYRPPVVRTESIAQPNLFACTPGHPFLCEDGQTCGTNPSC